MRAVPSILYVLSDAQVCAVFLSPRFYKSMGVLESLLNRVAISLYYMYRKPLKKVRFNAPNTKNTNRWILSPSLRPIYRRVQILDWSAQILVGLIPLVDINIAFFTHWRRAILPDRRVV